MVFEERQDSFEEAADCDFYVIVIVALHPVLNEEVVFALVEYDFVVAAGQLPEYFFDVAEGLEQSALPNLEYPSVGRHRIRIYDLMDRLLNGHVLLVAKDERRNKVIFLLGVAVALEQLAVVHIDDGHFLPFVVALVADEGLVADLLAAEVGRNQLRCQIVDYVIIVDCQNGRHLDQRFLSPHRLKLLFAHRQSSLLHLHVLLHRHRLEIVYELHPPI